MLNGLPFAGQDGVQMLSILELPILSILAIRMPAVRMLRKSAYLELGFRRPGPQFLNKFLRSSLGDCEEFDLLTKLSWGLLWWSSLFAKFPLRSSRRSFIWKLDLNVPFESFPCFTSRSLLCETLNSKVPVLISFKIGVQLDDFDKLSKLFRSS